MNKQIFMKEWINCRDRLPETSDNVLVYDGEEIFVAWYSRSREEWSSFDTQFDPYTPILAWMPLPTAPSTIRFIKA